VADGPPVTVIGVADDRLDLLAPEARQALASADAVVGGRRHLWLYLSWASRRPGTQRPEPETLEIGGDVDAVMGDALEAIRLIAILITPAMPSVAEEIWQRIGLDASPTTERFDVSVRWGGYPGATTVAKGAPLFPRIASKA